MTLAERITSVLAGTGFRPYAEMPLEDELIRDGGFVPTNREGVFRSVSSKGDEFYLTHSQACTCRAGLKDRCCYHLLAARILGIASRRSYAKAA